MSDTDRLRERIEAIIFPKDMPNHFMSDSLIAKPDQILELIQAEVLKGRIDEVKTIWGHAREHTLTDIQMIMHQTNGKVDFIEAVDTWYLEKRLNGLQSLRQTETEGRREFA